MADLIAPVDKEGNLTQYTSDVAKKRSTKGTSDLGKQEFLTLLVAQMQYQDPLNPASDTEFISQLASFSSLEQMQNLNATMTNQQSFSLIGSTVSIGTDEGSTVEGVVDFVTMSKGKAYVSIEGELYDAANLKGIVGEGYIRQQKAPTVEKTEAKYNHDDPKNIKINLSMGIDEGMASKMVVYLGNTPIDTKNMELDEVNGILTIKKEAFAKMDPGTHPIVIAFNDPLNTLIADKVTVTVTGTKPPEEEIKDAAPSVEKTEANYYKNEPENIEIKANMGKGEGMAEKLVVLMNGAILDSEQVVIDAEKGTFTIKKEAFANLPLGTYPITFSFTGKENTVISDKVTVTVSDIKPPEEDKDEDK